MATRRLFLKQISVAAAATLLGADGAAPEEPPDLTPDGVLELGPDDTLVLAFDRPMSEEQASRISDMMQGLGIERVLVTEGDVRFGVVHQGGKA